MKKIPKRTRYLSISLDVNIPNQKLLYEWLVKYQPKYRGDAIAELYKENKRISEGEYTCLENRLMSIVEGMLVKDERLQKKENDLIESVFEDKKQNIVDFDSVLDNEIEKILGE